MYIYQFGDENIRSAPIAFMKNVINHISVPSEHVWWKHTVKQTEKQAIGIL